MIEVKNLSVCYNKTEVVKNVNCAFSSSGLTIIMGANGSGKSTFLKAIVRLTPFSGEIFINSKNIKEFSRRELTSNVSYLAQTKELATMSVETLVQHGRFPHLKFPRVLSKKDKDIAKEVLERLNLTSIKSKNLLEISGGERQRAYIGMALCQKTSVMILDEPTVSLDPIVRREILNLIRNLSKEVKVILVHHDLSEAIEFADEIAVFKQGELLICDSPKAVLDSGALSKAFNAEVVLKESYSFK